MFSTLSKREIVMSAALYLYFANAFRLDQAKILSCVKEFNTFPNKPWFLGVCSTSLLKTLWEKEKLLVIAWRTFFHFHQVRNSRLQILSF